MTSSMTIMRFKKIEKVAVKNLQKLKAKAKRADSLIIPSQSMT